LLSILSAPAPKATGMVEITSNLREK